MIMLTIDVIKLYNVTKMLSNICFMRKFQVAFKYNQLGDNNPIKYMIN